MSLINTTDIAVTHNPGPNVNGVTLIYMCSLFGFMKEWLQEGGVSTDSDMRYDTDTTLQKDGMFSEAECYDYHKYTNSGYAVCADNSMAYEANPQMTQLH